MPTFVANSPVDMEGFMATGGLFQLYGTGTIVTNTSTTFEILDASGKDAGDVLHFVEPNVLAEPFGKPIAFDFA